MSTPEGALLVECARVQMDAPRPDRIRAGVRAGLDWTRVLELARAHGMRPLLFHHLTRVCPGALGPAVLDEMRAGLRQNAARNLVLTRELRALLDMFAAESIQAVPYKGPALAEALYGNLALREFTDLDILVRPADVVRAKALMIARSYRPQYDLPEGLDVAFRRAYCEYTFTDHATGTIVEIQWDLAPRFFSLDFDSDGAWRRLGAGTIQGATVPALSPEDLLFVLCVHGSKHAWSQLEWICGVAELIGQHPRLDWDLVRALAARARAARMLRLGLALARDLLDAPLPRDVEQGVREDRGAGRLAAEIAGRLFEPDSASDGSFARAVMHMRMREQWGDCVRYAWRLSSTPSARDWAMLSASRSSRALAYPVRLTRLAWKYASR